MKEEKEVSWLINLYLSDLDKNVCCVKDFERFLNAPLNDKILRVWFCEMKVKGIFIYRGKIDNGGFGNSVDGYSIDKNKIILRLKQIDFYNKLSRFFDSVYLFSFKSI